MSHMTQQVSVIQVDEMTVGDLTQILSTYPSDLKLVYPEREGGFNPIHKIMPEKLALNVNEEYYYGKHDYPSSIDPDQLKNHSQQLCLVLSK